MHLWTEYKDRNMCVPYRNEPSRNVVWLSLLLSSWLKKGLLKEP